MKSVILNRHDELVIQDGKVFLRKTNQYTGGVSVCEGKRVGDEVEFRENQSDWKLPINYLSVLFLEDVWKILI